MIMRSNDFFQFALSAGILVLTVWTIGGHGFASNADKGSAIPTSYGDSGQ